MEQENSIENSDMSEDSGDGTLSRYGPSLNSNSAKTLPSKDDSGGSTIKLSSSQSERKLSKNQGSGKKKKGGWTIFKKFTSHFKKDVETLFKQGINMSDLKGYK